MFPRNKTKSITLTHKQRRKIHNCDDVYSIMKEILLREGKIDREKEHFWVMVSSQNNCVRCLAVINKIRNRKAEDIA